jgi:hypothetical protein
VFQLLSCLLITDWLKVDPIDTGNVNLAILAPVSDKMTTVATTTQHLINGNENTQMIHTSKNKITRQQSLDVQMFDPSARFKYPLIETEPDHFDPRTSLIQPLVLVEAAQETFSALHHVDRWGLHLQSSILILLILIPLLHQFVPYRFRSHSRLVSSLFSKHHFHHHLHIDLGPYSSSLGLNSTFTTVNDGELNSKSPHEFDWIHQFRVMARRVIDLCWY